MAEPMSRRANRMVTLATLTTLAAAGAAARTPAKNVLLIGVDDLRPDVSGPYGQTQVKTPSIDRQGSPRPLRC